MAEIAITTGHRYINDAKIVDPPRDIIILIYLFTVFG